MSLSLSQLPLPTSVSSRQVDCTETVGLSFHILEAGRPPIDEPESKPLILLVHGYPELAFSWRKIMPDLATEGTGNHVIAVDQRGYGRTTGWDASPYAKTDLSEFTMTTLVRDLVTLVHAVGHRSVRCIVGHDFGAVSASMCALMRPDFFKACVLMSHPFTGSPSLPFNISSSEKDAKSSGQSDIHKDLASLDEPRKHYKWYNSMEAAADEWLHPAQGLQTFLRGYIHLKSANWMGNKPRPLDAWTATELAKMPYYYIMPLRLSMPEAVACLMRGEDEQSTASWLPEEDLAVYVQEWSRTGFQGGLNWYRAQTNPSLGKDVLLFAGKKIEVPLIFLSGTKDWGNYQEPGALERFPEVCSDFKGVVMIDGAGHWPQQEQPAKVTREIIKFLRSL